MKTPRLLLWMFLNAAAWLGTACEPGVGRAAPPAVEVRNLTPAGAFEVRNTGGEPVALAWKVTVEQRIEGEWKPVLDGVRLIEHCGDPTAGAARELAAGGTLRPVPWTGQLYGGQCPEAARANAYYGGLPLRYVVHRADGKENYAGPEFHLPADEPPPKVSKTR